MVFKCCVPGCRGNYDEQNKVNVFKFPADEELRNKWIRAIKRADFEPTKNSVVCHLHFLETDVLWESKAIDPQTGKILTAPLSRPQLSKTAIPCKLPNCPPYLSKSTTFHREAPTEKKAKLEASALQAAISNSLKSFNEFKNKYSFGTFAELNDRLCHISVGSEWSIITKSQSIIFLYLNTDKQPHDILYFIIDKELKVKVFCSGYEIQVCNVPEIVSSVQEIENIIKLCETILSKSISNHDSSEIIARFLENLNCGDKKKKTVEFLKSQLQLCLVPAERHRFDPQTIIFACLLFFISPHAYKFIRSHGSVILPHPSTIRNICGTARVDTKNENFLVYIEGKISFLQDHERIVILMIDEIHLKPFMDYKGGNVVGMAYDSNMLATTAHVFMIQGVLSSFKDVVHILPVNKMNADKLFDITKKVVVGLEKIGLKVICVVTDNNSINRKAMSYFASPPQISIVYPHPADSGRPLFFLIDTVHVFKCIRNNWINLKNDGCTFVYPDFFDDTKTNYASFSALRSLFESESHKLLKFGYGLSLKALWPSTFERQNVKLVVQVFSNHIANSLLQLGPTNNFQNYEGTARFIEIINKWWSVVNVKTPLKGLHSRDEMQQPLTNSLTDQRTNFLNQFLLWLDRWENMKLSDGTLTKETLSALKLSTYCLLQLTEYCMTELKMSYVLPGKFQTDILEARFGLYRRLSGSHYHVSIRQIFEAEKKLRVTSLLELSLEQGSSKRLFISSLDENETEYSSDNKNVEINFTGINVSEADLKSLDSDLPVLTYIAGYCCYSVLRKLQCETCSEYIVLDKSLVCGKEHELIKNLDRGGLKYPQELPVIIVMYAFIVMKKLLGKENAALFLKLENQRPTALRLISEVIWSVDELTINDFCLNHKIKDIYEKIIWICINILLNNYCKMMNNESAVKITNKRKLATVAKNGRLNITGMKQK